MSSTAVAAPAARPQTAPAWMPFPTEYYALTAEPGTVLLETSRFDQENYRSYLFRRPIEVITIEALHQVPGLFQRVEQELARGHYLAGYIGYECGYHFETAAAPPQLGDSGLPLAWLGVYEPPLVFDHRSGSFVGSEPPLPPDGDRSYEVGDARLGITRADYCAAIERIREYIAAGDIYQLDLTDDVHFRVSGSPQALYQALRQSQSVSWGAILNLGDAQVLSLSPELFFRLRQGHIVTRPMKGTARRGRFAAEDDRMAAWLHHDAKNRSENVMIVDLLRNDLGRIAEVGSVKVEKLFEVERYETLLQMTSTIAAELPPATRYYDIFRALFPCGSVTGAPKVRAMQILREMERRPRGVYTGAIGCFAPGGQAEFNVAIRTVVLHGGQGTMGVGGGIVWDSVPQQEYEECELKAQFLSRREEKFSLIESLLWDGGFRWLELHLERLRESAAYFGFAFHPEEVRGALEEEACDLPAGAVRKFRVLMDQAGGVRVESAALEARPGAGRVWLSPHRTCSHDRLLFHKTTRRALYDCSLLEAQAQGCEDAIFLNERGEVTEGAISNLFVQIGGRLYTPPMECGLLPGVYRRHLLAIDPRAEERVLRLEDLKSADAIYICNAVRGMRRVQLTD